MENNYEHIEETTESNDERERESLPSRVELHGHKYKPWWFLLPRKTETEDDEKQKKISVHFVLLLIILTLPAALALLIKQGDRATVIPVSSGPGEEISIETEDPYIETATPTNEPPKESVDEEDRQETKDDDKEKPSKQENPVEPEKVESKPQETKEQHKKKEAEEKKKNQKKKEEKVETNETTYHTVKPNETLYRIAMNYYQSPDGVEKIKRENGLSSNEISSGQRLKIPRP